MTLNRVESMDETERIREMLLNNQIDGVVALGKGVIRELLVIRKDTTPGASSARASKALMAFGKEAVPVLTDALKDANRNVRWSAAEGLGEIAEKGGDCSSAVPALSDTLNNEEEDVWVRDRAAWALVNIGENGGDCTPAIPAFVKGMGCDAANLRLSSIVALVNMGKAAVPAIVETMGGPELDEHVTNVLFRLDASALALMLESYGGFAPSVRSQVLLALRERTKAGQKIEESLQGTIPTLKLILHGNDEVLTRGMAAEVLGNIGHFSAAPILVRAMADSDVNVWLRAVNALKKVVQMNPGHDWPGLAERMMEALRVGKFGDPPAEILHLLGPQAIPALERAMLGVGDVKSRKHASLMFLQMAKENPKHELVVGASDRIVGLLAHENVDVGREATFAIGRMAEANPRNEALVKAIPTLVAFLGRGGNWKDSSFHTLAIMGTAAVPALVEALRKPDIRKEAAKLLWKIGTDKIEGDDKVLCLLILEDTDYLGKEAVPVLSAALKDADGRMRLKAAETLVMIAERTEIDLRLVQKGLEEYVDSMKQRSDRWGIRNVRKDAIETYQMIARAASKCAARRHSLEGDGVMLEGTFKPPAYGNKMYREGTRAFA